MFFGFLFMPFLLAIILYTVILQHLLIGEKIQAPWRQTAWMAVVDVLELIGVIERPAGNLVKGDLPFVRSTNQKLRMKAAIGRSEGK